MDNLPTVSESSTFLRHVSRLESAGIVDEKPLPVVLVTVPSSYSQHIISEFMQTDQHSPHFHIPISDSISLVRCPHSDLSFWTF